MMKLRFSKPTFKQYLNGRITVCKYDCTVIDNLDKSIVAEFSVTGTAKCSPNDTVSDFGIKLADSRAKLNAYKKASNLLPSNVIYEWIEELKGKASFIDFLAQMRYLKRKEIDHIEAISSNEV